MYNLLCVCKTLHFDFRQFCIGIDRKQCFWVDGENSLSPNFLLKQSENSPKWTKSLDF